MEDAGLLPDQQSAYRPVRLAQARGITVGDGSLAALDDILVGVGEIHLDIGLDLAPGGRGAGVEQQPGRPRRDGERLGARVRDRVVERDSRQRACAAYPVLAAVGIAAGVVEHLGCARPVRDPQDVGPGDAADAQ